MENGRLGSALYAGIALLLLLSLAFSQSAPVCAPNALTTFLSLNYTHAEGAADGTLHAFLYDVQANGGIKDNTDIRSHVGNIAPAEKSWKLDEAGMAKLQTGGVVSNVNTGPSAVGVGGALLLVVSGPYHTGAAYEPKSADPAANKVCKIITGRDGKASATIPYPDGGMSISHTVTFCPFTNSSADLAACAGLVDTGGKPVTDLNFNQMVDCPSSSGGAASDVATTSGGTKCGSGSPSNSDLRDCVRPSQNTITVSNSGFSNSQTSFCWMAVFAFGLLFAGAFMAGRNPLMAFDFGTARGVRTPKGTPYTPMTQMVSVNPISIAMAADKAIGSLTDLSGATDGARKTGLVGGQVASGMNKLTGKITDLVGSVAPVDEKTGKLAVTPTTQMADKAIAQGLTTVATSALVGLVAMVVPNKGKWGGKAGWKAAGKAVASTALSGGVRLATGLAGDAAKIGVMAGVTAAKEDKDLVAMSAEDAAELKKKLAGAASGLAATANHLRDSLSAQYGGVELVVVPDEKGGFVVRKAQLSFDSKPLLDINGNKIPLSGEGAVVGRVSVATDMTGQPHHMAIVIRDPDSGREYFGNADASGRVVWSDSKGSAVGMMIAGRMQEFSGSGQLSAVLMSVGQAIWTGDFEAMLHTVLTPITAIWRPLTDTQGYLVHDATRQISVGLSDGSTANYVIRESAPGSGAWVVVNPNDADHPVGSYDAKSGKITISDNEIAGLKPGTYVFDGRNLREDKPVGSDVKVAGRGGGTIDVDGQAVIYSTRGNTQTLAIGEEAALGHDSTGRPALEGRDITIQRDESGKIVSIQDKDGKEVRSLTINGKTYAISVVDDPDNRFGQVVKISQAGMLANTTAETWTAKFFDKTTGEDLTAKFFDKTTGEDISSSQMTYAKYIEQTVVARVFADIDNAFGQLNDALVGMMSKSSTSAHGPGQNFMQTPGSATEMWIGAGISYLSGVGSNIVSQRAPDAMSVREMRTRDAMNDALQARVKTELKNLNTLAGDPERFEERNADAENENYSKYIKKVNGYQSDHHCSQADAVQALGVYRPKARSYGEEVLDRFNKALPPDQIPLNPHPKLDPALVQMHRDGQVTLQQYQEAVQDVYLGMMMTHYKKVENSASPAQKKQMNEAMTQMTAYQSYSLFKDAQREVEQGRQDVPHAFQAYDVRRSLAISSSMIAAGMPVAPGIAPKP